MQVLVWVQCVVGDLIHEGKNSHRQVIGQLGQHMVVFGVAGDNVGPPPVVCEPWA